MLSIEMEIEGGDDITIFAELKQENESDTVTVYIPLVKLLVSIPDQSIL